MAESIVCFVACKLGDLVAKEAELLGGVGDKVKSVHDELVNIRCYLADADSKQRRGDTSAENWLNQLRDVAYRIEDATDTFYVELEDHLQNESFLRKLQHWGHKSKKVSVVHKLAKELDDVQKELGKIFSRKDQYGIKPLQDHGRGEPVILPKRRAAYQDVDETEVVGLDADMNKILYLLRDEKTCRRAVITIVGGGGLGKTTLARMVYKSAKVDFEYHIILSVSQQYSLTNLLRKMISMVNNSDTKKQELDDLISELKSLLRRRKYLIVLDDVWVEELWDQLQHAFPDDKNGSRILVTSRSIDVAKSADPGMPPYILDFLNDKKSLELFLKKALPYQEPDKKCSSDLLELANDLSKKCKGLPLALIVLGGIISTKDQTYHQWKKVLDTMNWHQEGKDCMQVLAMSYEDMPYYLKACFLYLALFPEDYEIPAKHLIRMWVSEGFISQSQEERKTMEEISEFYLEQLFQRCMVQVSSRCPNGSFKSCRVHDLLRDLAIHEAGKENFITVNPKPQNANHPNKVIRRVSLQSDCSQFMEYIGSNTRSLLLWFGPSNDDLSKYSVLKLLRVLEIVDSIGLKIKPTVLDRLIHLKLLRFRNCTQLTFHKDCSWGRLKNLETLDIRRNGEAKDTPSLDIWTIGTLRHVMCDLSYFKGPPSNLDLRNLQTLQWVEVMETWLKNQLPRLHNLRKLGLDNRHGISKTKINWEVVAQLLGNLPYLLSLGIKGSDIPMEIVYPRGLPNYQNLQTLRLHGEWCKNVALDASLFPPHLVKLTLVNSCLRQNPMPELGKLESLKELRLGHTVYAGENLICPSGFPVLQTLYLHLVTSKITSFTVMEGVMPKLKNLEYVPKLEVRIPPELKQFKKVTQDPYTKDIFN